MATHNAPAPTELDVEGEREALRDGLQRESAQFNDASMLADESLPPLLKIISTGDYSFMECDSPVADAHAAINIPDVDFGNASKFFDDKEYGIELTKDKGSFSHGDSGCEQPEASTVDLSKLAPVRLNTSNHSTPKSGGVLTPKSILSRRGGPPSTPHGALTPRGIPSELGKKVSFRSMMENGDSNNTNLANDEAAATDDPPQVHKNSTLHDASKKVSRRKFFSQPMPTTEKLVGTMRQKGSTYSGPVRRCTTNDPHDSDNAKKENYVIFRTKSAKLDRPLSRRHSRQSRRHDPSFEGSSSKGGCDEGKAVPAGRYFDALKGPELEFVKDSEELLLPLNQKWPFLLRFPIGCFGICLGLGSQAMLWKSLATLSSMSFLKIPLAINFVLWCLSVLALSIISITYALKCLLYFEAVRREYYHPVRVNFFFAPWIACMFLTLSVPPRIATTIHPALWCIFTTPLLLLKLKIYGQWLSGGQRRLSKVANPSTHLSLVGNFVSALLAAIVGWDEPAVFFWAVGCAHYLVVFVTLYQRLPTAEILPKELHPVFFLFVAAPSAASVAWKSIVGNFDRLSRVAYFLGLFLYSSLVVRINFFRGFQFSVTWWAYTFPMAASAIATMHYSIEVHHPITQGMAVVLSCISSVTVLSVFVATLYHALKGNLFPNDVAIAITRKRHKRKQKGLKSDSLSENKTEKCDDDSTKLYLPSEGGTIVASLQNGLISVTSDPFPVSGHAITQQNGAA